MVLSRGVLLGRLRRCRVARPFGQFGTSDDECTDNGALGCTHSVWRFIVFVYTGKWVSHDVLSRVSGYPCGGGSTNRGMRIIESQAIVSYFHLPYVYRANMTPTQLLHATANGPVLFAMRYGSYPNWRDYHGVTRPKPWARPYRAAGRNQFTGFYGAHAGALLGYVTIRRSDGTFVRQDCYVFEPNHDSPSRPENVAFDIITGTQFGRAYYATKTILGWTSTMAFVPTRQPTFPSGVS